MGFVGIVSDSTAGLPMEIVARHGIRVVPLYVSMGELREYGRTCLP